MDASVIIPTYNRSKSLQEVLISLSEQTLPANCFEVIIIDDGSTDDTEDVALNTYPFTLKYIRQRNQGSAVARNRGAEEASGDLLIFIDDDVHCKPDYIRGLVEEHRTHERIVGMGTFLPDEEGSTTPYARIWNDSLRQSDGKRESEYVSFTECVTNNLSVKKDNFYEIGKMQDVAGDGPTWWGDVDFGYRAERLGFRFRRSHLAKCIHRDYAVQDLTIARDRAYKTAMMGVLLFQKHPGAKPYLPMFRDKEPISWSGDSPNLILRKVFRRIASTSVMLTGMQGMANLFETYYPKTGVLEVLYRWIIGGYIFRGYRDGLHKYEVQG